MAHRYWESAAIASKYAKYRPIAPTGMITRILNYMREKYDGPLSLAVDVGCGSGQSTHLLSPHFQQVIGTDVSPSMVEQASKQNKSANVTFKVSTAEVIPAEDKSVQLISASQAAHWFDLPKFYEEGKRVLSPGGILCFIGYELPRFVWSKDPSKEDALNAALMEFYMEDLDTYVLPHSKEVYLGKYKQPKYRIAFAEEIIRNQLRGCWADAERRIVDSRYASYVIPYASFTRDESFSHEVETSVEDIVMLTTTWSGFTNFCQKHGDEEGGKLLVKYRSKLMEILNVPTSPEETMFIKRTPFFLLMGRSL